MRKEDQKSVYGVNHPTDEKDSHGPDHRVEKDTAEGTQGDLDAVNEAARKNRQTSRFERATSETAEAPRD